MLQLFNIDSIWQSTLQRLGLFFRARCEIFESFVEELSVEH